MPISRSSKSKKGRSKTGRSKKVTKSEKKKKKSKAKKSSSDPMVEVLTMIEKHISRSEMKGSDQGIMPLLIHAAVVKSFEFVEVAVSSDAHSAFMVTAMLRGICDDLIALKYLTEIPKENAEKILPLLLTAECSDTSRSQRFFFKTNHPSQVVYSRDEDGSEFEDCREKIKQLLPPSTPIKSKYDLLPTVRHMADKIGIADLYDYLYHGTSRFVHFSARGLLRMGWGDGESFRFSSKNYEVYYRDFSIFWGSWLLVEFVKLGCKVGVINMECLPYLDPLENTIRQRERWPELITFEEMNITSWDLSLLGIASAIASGKHPKPWQVDILKKHGLGRK